MLRIVLPLVLAFVAFAMNSSLAYAATVTIDGGFTSFSGVVGFDVPGEATFVNGVQVLPTSPLPASGLPWNAQSFPNIGYGSIAFPRVTPTVQFSILPSLAPGTDNIISFTTQPQGIPDPGQGTDPQGITLGRFHYTNGDFWSGVARRPGSCGSVCPGGSFGSGYYGDFLLGFTLTTHSSLPAYDGHVYTDILHLVITRQTFPPLTAEQNADYFFFEGHPELGSVRVFERQDFSNIGSVGYVGHFGSLIPDGFTDPQGGLFLYPSIDPIPDLAPTPEPATLLLFATTAAGLGWARWRRKA